MGRFGDLRWRFTVRAPGSHLQPLELPALRDCVRIRQMRFQASCASVWIKGMLYY